MSRRAAVSLCAVATVLIAGAGIGYRATLQAPREAAGPDPVVTTLPARGAPPSRDPLVTAQRHLQRARITDDPREDSYAEAALAPLFASGRPPVAASFLRAVLEQRRHDFAAANRDLDAVLAAEPNHPDARLTLAFVELATGQAHAAEHTCEALRTAASLYVQDACFASVWMRLGRSREALVKLQRWTKGDSGLGPGELAWLYSLQAEAAENLDLPEAEADYAKSLELDPADRYTRVTYADWLLDHDRAREVLDVVRAPGEETDALLLRRALAERATGGAFGPAATTLRARYDAMTARGDPLHLREEVRFRAAFDPTPDPAKLLALSLANYGNQREPWDARVLLEACVRAGHRAPCAAVLADTAALEHPRIRALRAEVERLTP